MTVQIFVCSCVFWKKEKKTHEIFHITFQEEPHFENDNTFYKWTPNDILKYSRTTKLDGPHSKWSNCKRHKNDILTFDFLFQDSGTARPIQRKLTSQLQSETESAEDKAKHTEHLELSAELTKLLLPVLLEVRLFYDVFFFTFWPFSIIFEHQHRQNIEHLELSSWQSCCCLFC